MEEPKRSEHARFKLNVLTRTYLRSAIREAAVKKRHRDLWSEEEFFANTVNMEIAIVDNPNKEPHGDILLRALELLAQRLDWIKELEKEREEFEEQQARLDVESD